MEVVLALKEMFPRCLWLDNGTTENVRREVKRCIDSATEGGGFMSAVGDSIDPKVKPSDLRVMRATSSVLASY